MSCSVIDEVELPESFIVKEHVDVCDNVEREFSGSYCSLFNLFSFVFALMEAIFSLVSSLR